MIVNISQNPSLTVQPTSLSPPRWHALRIVENFRLGRIRALFVWAPTDRTISTCSLWRHRARRETKLYDKCPVEPNSEQRFRCSVMEFPWTRYRTLLATLAEESILPFYFSSPASFPYFFSVSSLRLMVTQKGAFYPKIFYYLGCCQW